MLENMMMKLCRKILNNVPFILMHILFQVAMIVILRKGLFVPATKGNGSRIKR